MREWTHVGTGRHGHTRRQLPAKLARMHVQLLAQARLPSAWFRMRGKILGNREGRHRKNFLLVHEPHGFIAQPVRVIDRNYTGVRGVQRAWLAGRMHGYAPAGARRFFDCRTQFRFGVLIGSRKFSIAQRVLASLIDLDEIRAFFELLANDRYQLLYAVGVGGVR
jgi:hypothetical protein